MATNEGNSESGEGGAGARSGCTLIAAAMGVFALVIGVSIFSFVGQDREIAKFTQDDQEKTRIAEGVESEVAALRAKLDTFSEGTKAGEEVELELTMDELNLIIAETESGKDYRGMVYFTGTRETEGGGGDVEGKFQPRQLVADVCMTMNKMKFWEKRYLVGEMEFDLRKVPAGLDLIVTGVAVPEKEVPQQFIEGFANWHWLAPFHDDPEMKPVLEAIRGVEILEDRVVLHAGGKTAAG